MLPGLVLALREGLEAALVVGIMLGILKKQGHSDRTRWVWLGVIAATITSILVAIGLTTLGAEMEGEAEALFEGLTTLLAAAVLTWMIFWMRKQGRSANRDLEGQVRRAVADGSGGGLFAVSFLAVGREGTELALFLTAAMVTASAAQTWLGAIGGLALATALGWAVFASTVRLDLRRFFQATGVILLIFAAGLVARSIHEFVEIRWLPALIEHVWDTGSVLAASSAWGQLAESLLGYQASPSLTEVLGYTSYLSVVLALMWQADRTSSLVSSEAHHISQAR